MSGSERLRVNLDLDSGVALGEGSPVRVRYMLSAQGELLVSSTVVNTGYLVK